MQQQNIEKVKAEIARLKDMQVRLKDVEGDTEDESGAMFDGRSHLDFAVTYFQEALDYAEGRKTSEPREVLPEELEDVTTDVEQVEDGGMPNGINTPSE